MHCRYCNANLPDGAAFCAVCGQKQEPVKEAVCFCPNCGVQLHSGEAFCGNCGTKIEKAAAAPAVPKKKPAVPNLTLPKLRIPKKGIIAGLGVVAAVLVILLAVSLFGGSSDTGVVYLKDGQLQHIPASGKEEAHTLTERLSGNKSADAGDLLDLAMNDVYGKIRLSADGKKLFYPDRFDGKSYTLFCQDLSNTKKDPVKIDSGLTDSYQINEKGTLVTYLKDGKLYQHDLKEKTKISGDVTKFYVTDDGDSLLYEKAEEKEPAATEAPAAEAEADTDKKEEKKRNYNGVTVYRKTGREDPVKLEEDIYQYNFSEDHSSIYYLIGYDLYLVKDGGEPSKVATDVADIWGVGKGGCYFSVKEEETIVSWDLIEDDLQNEESEHMRGVLEDRTITNPVSQLYFHNGKESVLVEKQMRNARVSAPGDDFFCYTAVAGDALPTFKLSEYADYDGSFTDLVKETLEEHTGTYVAQGTKTAELPLENIYRIIVGEKGETLWVMTDYDEKATEVTLHQVKVSGGTVKSVEEIDDEVYFSNFLTDGKNYVYWKSVKNYEGELYYNGKEIADDVRVYGSMDADSGTVFFMSDYSTKNGEYALCFWNGKKVVTVDEDVRRHMALGDNCIAYLKDYSTSRQEGDLYIWAGKKPVKLDEDVMYILPVYRK